MVNLLTKSSVHIPNQPFMTQVELLGNDILLNVSFGKKPLKPNENVHSFCAKFISKLNLLRKFTIINDMVYIKFCRFH